jgi:hypothetical protein
MRFPEKFRQPMPGTRFETAAGDAFGAFKIPPHKFGKTGFTRTLKVIASSAAVEVGVPWEHVSVSLWNARSCPSWDEMCLVKELFWEPEACVVQYHPPASNYVNVHPGCLHLHLWRPTAETIPMPPTFAV